MPLAPDTVRIDTQSSGLLFTGQTVPATMKAAATATLNAGYTHFRMTDANTGIETQTSTACSWGRYGGGRDDVNHDVTKAGVTVHMFHANEPGAQGAFEARAVLAQYGS
jgi:hypothetical protein